MVAFFEVAKLTLVRTFNAGYILSVILGLGVGEIMFGRMERTHDAIMVI